MLSPDVAEAHSQHSGAPRSFFLGLCIIELSSVNPIESYLDALVIDIQYSLNICLRLLWTATEQYAVRDMIRTWPVFKHSKPNC